MGKNVGLIGSVSGKVGSVVYAMNAGIQTVRVYQPHVLNPKSAAQTAQRAKMALAGRLSSLVPNSALLGLNGSSKAFRRGDFVRGIVRSAISYGAAGESAKIAPEHIVFSKGVLQSYARSVNLAAEVPAGGATFVDVTMTQNVSASYVSARPAGYGELMVVLAINSDTSQFDMCKTAIVNLPTPQTAGVTSVRFYTPSGTADPYQFYVYTIPFVAEMGAGASDYSFLGNEEGISVVVAHRLRALPLNFGASIYEGQVAIS